MDKYFVKHFHSIPPPYGGVSVYVKRLSLSLCKLGFISSAFSQLPVTGLPAEYHCLYSPFPKHTRSILILPELIGLFLHVKKYKIFHSHATLSTSFTTWCVRNILRKPIVYTVHSQMIERDISYLNWIDLFCFKALARDSKVQFLTVNSIAKVKMENLGIDFFNPIKVVVPYIPPVQIGQEEDYLSSNLIRFKKTNSQYILFYAESFDTNEGHDIYGTETAIDAFIKINSVLNNIALVFCMPNIGEKYDRLDNLKNKVENAGLSSKVFWQIGPISEMWPILKDAILYLRPTSTDGDSILLREALGLGVQSLASDATHRPPLCNIYPFGNTEFLVNKAIDLIKNPRKNIPDNPNYLDDIISVYNSLLS